MKRQILNLFTIILLGITLMVACKKEPVRSVSLTPTFLELAVGETGTVTVTIIPTNADNQKVTWEISDPNVATVDNGKVTAKAIGRATLTVTTHDGHHTATCVVFVPKPLDPEMVFVEGGTFLMGCSDGDCYYTVDGEPFSNEIPQHPVTLSSFYIGKYVITQKEWVAVMGSNPSYFEGDDLPVESVSWYAVQGFLEKLNKLTGKNYRLPTEAEWEYAARGGNQSKGYIYSGSNYPTVVAWFDLISNEETHPVGKKLPNELGIYDMSGNVVEWCSDFNGRIYTDEAQINPEGIALSIPCAIERGGSYAWRLWDCRVSTRLCREPFIRGRVAGFRVVLPAD